MVHPVHHATVKKAEKLGFIITGGVEDEWYTIRWPERNKTFNSRSSKQAVEDMVTLKMITLEHSKFKAFFDPKANVWTVKGPGTGRKGVQNITLIDAFIDATEGKSSYDEEAEDLDDQVEGEDDEDQKDDEDQEGRSIIKKKYKRRYRPFKMTCGDEVSQLVSEHVKEKIDTENGTDRRINPDKLKKFAKLNGCWVDKYAHMNIGMQRMNIVNRLRARIRKENWEIVWN